MCPVSRKCDVDGCALFSMMAYNNSIPKLESVFFTRPPEWTDEDRMHFLLAPFPLSTSPSPQDPKLSFWYSLILSSSKELKKPSFTEEELKTRFKWNGSLSPSCLGPVIESMERSGVITKQRDFTKSSDAGWLLWGLKMVVAKPVGWALSSYLPGDRYTGSYIITSLVKEYAEKVILKHQQIVLHKSTDLVMKAADFDTLSSELVSSDVLPLVKTSLIRDGAIVSKSTELGYNVLKICDGKRTDISEVDVGIVRIKESVKSLKEQVDSLTLRVQKLKQSARENIKDKKKAVRLLRQSKTLEGLLVKREGALDNLQTALQQIQMAETDKMIVDAYKSSVRALKSVREGLTLEGVEETLEELRETMDEGQEISAALSEGVGDSLECDDDELERDLAELLGPQQSETVTTDQGSSVEDELEAQLAALSLQQVPLSTPKVSQLAKRQTPMLA